MESLVIGLLAALGGLAYNVWGFLKAWYATRGTPEEEVFDPLRTVVTVVPVLVGAFIAGYSGQLSPSGLGDYVSIVVGGFGVGAGIGMLGIDSFFSKPANPSVVFSRRR